ncbi:MAG: chemotaxis protein CheX [Nitrospirae bacterium]|nr:chemotaxis protein CheX [Nitrospirota bacterium]MBF0541464.1 chemotaxis protein CheX [Nitrospirota bacterium]
MTDQYQRSPGRGLLKPINKRSAQMQSEDRETLLRLLEVVLEQLAFMFIEEAEKEDLIVKDGEYLHVSMNFSGFQHGKIEMALHGGMSKLVAANILGIDDEEMIKQSANDAVKELLNIYCGQMLTTIFSSEDVFDLSVPEVNNISIDEWNIMVDDSNTIGVKIEEFPLLVRLSI